MTCHNAGRIDWNLLQQAIKPRKSCKNYHETYFVIDENKISHFVVSFLNQIQLFSSTPRKNKNTKNLFLAELDQNNIDINPIVWLNIDINSDNIYHKLYESENRNVYGPIPHIISCYVYLNLFLTGFEGLNDNQIINDFQPWDMNLPDFLTEKFRLINCKILKTTTSLNSDQIKEILDFCKVLFEIICISNFYYPCTYDELMLHTTRYFY